MLMKKHLAAYALSGVTLGKNKGKSGAKSTHDATTKAERCAAVETALASAKAEIDALVSGYGKDASAEKTNSETVLAKADRVAQFKTALDSSAQQQVCTADPEGDAQPACTLDQINDLKAKAETAGQDHGKKDYEKKAAEEPPAECKTNANLAVRIVGQAKHDLHMFTHEASCDDATAAKKAAEKAAKEGAQGPKDTYLQLKTLFDALEAEATAAGNDDALLARYIANQKCKKARAKGKQHAHAKKDMGGDAMAGKGGMDKDMQGGKAGGSFKDNMGGKLSSTTWGENDFMGTKTQGGKDGKSHGQDAALEACKDCMLPEEDTKAHKNHVQARLDRLRSLFNTYSTGLEAAADAMDKLRAEMKGSDGASAGASAETGTSTAAPAETPAADNVDTMEDDQTLDAEVIMLSAMSAAQGSQPPSSTTTNTTNNAVAASDQTTDAQKSDARSLAITSIAAVCAFVAAF